MSIDVLERAEAEQLVARWRESADGDNPAGALYTGGAYAEADIVAAAWAETVRCSSCTASLTRLCC
ncbi:DUF6229 family protein [Micromonospora sp. WMMD882]|uniref:DUF6229 family protein n=1 Tax=Micromonospora sp. WMMD882 TaxID=3015151 RepID=UPI00248B4D9F|nr:DUF6229 family protein [Micromonospora sp. WMMD882]WBB80306.1 DUF6229 family protein [Micromonospora sp. WMMD882]